VKVFPNEENNPLAPATAIVMVNIISATAAFEADTDGYLNVSRNRMINAIQKNIFTASANAVPVKNVIATNVSNSPIRTRFSALPKSTFVMISPKK
jgi:hypothetical protein